MPLKDKMCELKKKKIEISKKAIEIHGNVTDNDTPLFGFGPKLSLEPQFEQEGFTIKFDTHKIYRP